MYTVTIIVTLKTQNFQESWNFLIDYQFSKSLSTKATSK